MFGFFFKTGLLADNLNSYMYKFTKLLTSLQFNWIQVKLVASDPTSKHAQQKQRSMTHTNYGRYIDRTSILSEQVFKPAIRYLNIYHGFKNTFTRLSNSESFQPMKYRTNYRLNKKSSLRVISVGETTGMKKDWYLLKLNWWKWIIRNKFL